MPSGAPDRVTMELVRETVRVWQPCYATPISLDDAAATLRRVGQLFGVLSGK